MEKYAFFYLKYFRLYENNKKKNFRNNFLQFKVFDVE